VSPARSDPCVTAAALAAAVALFQCGAAAAEVALRVQPADRDEIVAVLPRAVAERLTRARDWREAMRRAEALMGLARETGDARFLGRAQAMLDPWLGGAPAPPRVAILASDLAQQRHEFAAAKRLVDGVLKITPRDPEAHLKRANLALLTGDFAGARDDCRALLALGEALPGTICVAAATTGPGAVERATDLLAALGDSSRVPTELGLWRLSTQADLASRAGEARAALAFLARAHALAPQDAEIRARYASALLEAGEANGALALARVPNASAALLLVEVRAAFVLDPSSAATARRALDARLATARRRGGAAHLREEAELALYVDRAPARALALARRNFAIQKDTPDLRVLADAAIAARDASAVASVREWLARTGFEDRVAFARLERAGA
jgi:hypothetical protein